jgi:hypothetical protein
MLHEVTSSMRHAKNAVQIGHATHTQPLQLGCLPPGDKCGITAAKLGRHAACVGYTA